MSNVLDKLAQITSIPLTFFPTHSRFALPTLAIMSANDYYAGGKPQGQYGSPQGQYYPPTGTYYNLPCDLASKENHFQMAIKDGS